MSQHDELKAKVEDLERRVGKLESLLAPSPGDQAVTNRAKQLSVREFLLTLAVDSDPKKAVALGYYLEHIQGMDSFSVSDLESAFRAAKERVPKNINETVNKNIKRGFMMEAAERKESKKAWCITASGEKFFERELKVKNSST